MADQLILTPGGWRRKSLVHLIESGHVLDGTGDRYRKLDSSGNLLADFGTILRRSGNAPLMPANVSQLAGVGGKPGPLGTGWIVYAGWTNNTGRPILSFSTTWTVPAAPTKQDKQLIFLFSGIQNSTMIYQPVLQWGVGAATGGGYSWGVASWYADGQGGQAFYTALVPVNIGDVLVGVITLTKQSENSLFSYNCEFKGITKTSLPITNVQELTWCIETLEAYALQECSDYPDVFCTKMTAIAIQTSDNAYPAVNWTSTDSIVDCGQAAVVVNSANPGAEVDLCYSAQPPPPPPAAIPTQDVSFLFGRDSVNNKKSLYPITTDGRLAQIWDTDVWNLDFPAEETNASANTALRFQPGVAVFGRDAVNNKKSLYAITTDGRLAQIWDTDVWNLDFPAEQTNTPTNAALRFQPGVGVFGRDSVNNKKSLYAITTDGRLAQIWDTDTWNMDFPAEKTNIPGNAGLRFTHLVRVFGRDPVNNKKSLYAITTDGRLAQIWDTDVWNLDFPAEQTNTPTNAALRFRPGVGVFGRDSVNNKKSLYAITTDGRLAQIWDTDTWNMDFPAEKTNTPGNAGLRFTHLVGIFGRDPVNNKKSLYAITTDGRLAQIWDTDVWNLDFPAEQTNTPTGIALRFQPGVNVFGRDPVNNKKSLYAFTADGRLAQIWDTDVWNMDFPAEETNMTANASLRFQEAI